MSHLFLEGTLIVRLNELSHIPFPLAKYTVSQSRCSSRSGCCSCSTAPTASLIGRLRATCSRRGRAWTTRRSLAQWSICFGNRGSDAGRPRSQHAPPSNSNPSSTRTPCSPASTSTSCWHSTNPFWQTTAAARSAAAPSGTWSGRR
jgi:hypothetical protein